MAAKKKTSKSSVTKTAKKSAPKKSPRRATAAKPAKKAAPKRPAKKSSKLAATKSAAGVVYADVRRTLSGGLIGRLLGS